MLICKQKINLRIWNLSLEISPLKIWIISGIYFAASVVSLNNSKHISIFEDYKLRFESSVNHCKCAFLPCLQWVCDVCVVSVGGGG